MHTIKGELVVRGCHKYGDIEEDFSYNLPVLISVDDKYETEKATISVDDFYYEIINDNILRVKIDLLLDDLYYNEQKKIDELREVVADEPEIIKKEIQEEEKIEIPKNNEVKNDTTDLFENIEKEDKEYSIYRVYVIDENDTLNSILEKYKVTKEELEELNDLSNFKAGIKLIIPSTNE